MLQCLVMQHWIRPTLLTSRARIRRRKICEYYLVHKICSFIQWQVLYFWRDSWNYKLCALVDSYVSSAVTIFKTKITIFSKYRIGVTILHNQTYDFLHGLTLMVNAWLRVDSHSSFSGLICSHATVFMCGSG